ncbi:Response regulator receiver domain-containing protein [Allochromatium warmingii]|uniref:Response regulator receiver domain-containing protein n=1 Tax=Allochromatium warmingii TaxID=61595 RepID=A0A1H3AU55_ALLWA|nr:fused response regulator/phosphatase [Allochromatium warmingii]SDX33226.1 Response regulator receiver domain-containing protein [Allochromatium warmingii]
MSQPASERAALAFATTPMSVGERGLALIVDDEPSNRRLLSLMLIREGFRTQEASNGCEALELFDREQPDIVFMDVVMPEMDGLEATLQIKQRIGDTFIPVIFLTALKDEQALLRCIEAGGDDFLAKPFSVTRLKARILAMERVRNLQRALAAKQTMLETLLERDQEEKQLAERVWTQAVKHHNAQIPAIGLIERPATIFNGDLVLIGYLPDGGLRILLGDFTGHGLSATIGTLPVSETFHAMTTKGFSDSELLTEINLKLYHFLPTERFMAAYLISLPSSGHTLWWWNGGMPTAYVRTATERVELSSFGLPLGIVPELQDVSLRALPITAGDRLLLMSDGLLEAPDTAGQMFIEAGFSTCLQQWQHGAAILPTLMDAFDTHCVGTEPTDDVAVMELPLDISVLCHQSKP